MKEELKVASMLGWHRQMTLTMYLLKQNCYLPNNH